MWYVLQVRSGTEENIKRQCEKNIPNGILEQCFIPYYEEQRHVRGEWITFRKVQFPGYLFVVTEELEQLYRDLKSVIGFTKLIGTGKEVAALTEEEILLLQRLGGDEHVAVMSEGIIEQSQVKVTSGPLAGMEGCIRRIDRHKRRAWLEVDMFGRKQLIQAGLEIVAKNY